MRGARFGCTTATRSRSSDSRGTSDPGRRPVRSPAPRAPESCGLRQSPGSRARDERVERRRKRQRRQERPASVVCSGSSSGFRNYGDVWVERIPLLCEEGWLRHQNNAAKRPSGAAGVVRPAQRFAELTTPALRATPPLRGGEWDPPIRNRNYEKQYLASTIRS